VFDRLGLDASDRRNAAIVVMVMFLVLVEGPILVRVVSAAVLGLVSGLFSLLLTALLNLLTG